MKDSKEELSSRYYKAETAIWLLGSYLMYSSLIGLPSGLDLKVFQITPENSQQSYRIIAALLLVAMLYMVFEWRLSPSIARGAPWNCARLYGTDLWAVTSLWVSYPLISQHTQYENVSPAWYLGGIALGFLLGFSTLSLILGAIVIRTPEESKRLQLYRIPSASMAQFVTWGPVTLILLIANCILYAMSPPEIAWLVSALVICTFILIVLDGWSSMFLAREANGKRIPYAKRLANFKEIFDMHDYSYLLAAFGDRFAKEGKYPLDKSPQKVQEIIQERYAAKFAKPVAAHIQQVEDMSVEPFHKDGDAKNHDPMNLGVRITKDKSKDAHIRFRFALHDDGKDGREVSVPFAILEKFAEEYIRDHPELKSLDLLDKAITHAVNKAVIETMAEKDGPALHKLVMSGLEEQVTELLKKGANVNERAEGGWTPLLYASAQGYPQIARSLLEAGANPDIGNLLGITPLMYGANYGNADVCRILLEFEAGVDVKDMQGNTALHVACARGFPEIVKLLLDANADPGIMDMEGETAVDIAYSKGYGQIVKMLKRANKEIKRAS